MSAHATRYDLGAPDRAALEVRDASAGVCFFPIPLRGAQALLPGDGLRAVATAPGTGVLGVAFIDARDGSLGPGRQAALLVGATPAPRARWLGPVRGAVAVARRRVPFHVFQHPVDDERSRAVAADRFGLPSAVHGLDVRYEPSRARCEIVMHGKHVLTLSMPRGGAESISAAPVEVLSLRDGVPHRARGTCEAEGCTAGGRRVELLLGDHPLADRLRRLGLPRRPSRSYFVESLRARVDAPERLGAATR